MRYLILALLSLVSGASFAQLSGNYTIGGTTSATNYATWGDFTSAVANSGVSGSVSVKVMSDLTVTNPVEFKQNSSNPTTSSKKIAIDGNGKKITGALTYEVLFFNGMDFLEIQNLSVVNSGTSSSGMCVRLASGADDNVVSGCTLEFSNISSSTKSPAAYLAFASSQTNVLTVSSSNNGVRNTIKNCVMTTSNANSPGPLYAIVDQQGSATYAGTGTENAITGNTIKNFYKTAITLQYVNGETVSGNDISRSAAGSSSPIDTVVYAIYITNGACTNASLQLSNNAIHDLPYVGASAGSATNYISQFWGFFCGSVSGKSTYPVVISGNECKNVGALTNISVCDVSNSKFLSVKKNSWVKLKADKSRMSYGCKFSSCAELEITENVIRHCSFGSSSGTGKLFDFDNCGNSSYAWNRFENNVLDSNTAGDALVCLEIAQDGDWQINRNRFVYNVAQSTSSSVSVVLLSYLHDLIFASNLLAHNEGYNTTDNYYCVNFNTGYKAKILQNTIYSRQGGSSSHFASALFMYEESELTIVGNILDVRGDYYGYGIYIYSSNKPKELNNNTCNISFASGEYWADGPNYFNTWADYKVGGVAGSGEYFGDPNWVDVAKNDFRSVVFENQNNVPTDADNASDLLGKKRALGNSDRGSTESFMDLSAVKTGFTVGSQICSGYESKVDVTVKNNYTDTAYKFYVAYALNGKITRQLVSTKILPKDSLKVEFTVPLKINNPGAAVIQVFIDAFDDNRKNDTFTFKTFVKKAPGGGVFEFSNKKQPGNNPFYQRGKPFDVTLVNVPVIYDVTAPRAFTNADYGTSSVAKWNASVTAVTASGRSVTGASLTAPSGSVDLEVQFKTADVKLEDSTITLLLKISDIVSGCDTILRRQVLIYPGVTVDFGLPKKFCVGDSLIFVNSSKYVSGYVENWWSYGTGKSGDTSNLMDGGFRYKTAGNYQVRLRGTTVPYGFVFEKVVLITVNPVPVASFSRQNACFGEAIKFVNLTKPATADMYWEFGDGNGFVLNNATNISLKYKATQSYLVHLVADIAGCQSKETQKVTQFAVPTVSFVAKSGKCEGDLFEFQNNSQISEGSLGSRWFMNSSDSISNETNANWRFYTSGNKTVKLLVKSEFGCKDSLTRTIRVFESPKSDFAYDASCIRTATQFVNQTPTVVGAVANYTWDFGDGKSSSASSPKHNWSTLGKKVVKFKVNLDNGCKDSITKTLDVLIQPEASFIADPVCSGDEMVFINKSTASVGKMSYAWEFGDNSNSTLENPKKRYSVKQTTAYNVTLVVNLQGGCSDSITKAVTVQELPRTCDFVASPDYQFAFFGLSLEPMDDVSVAGGQAGIDYTWTVAGLGAKSSKDVNAKVSYDLQQDGLYTVTIKSVVRATGCECSKTKQVVMDRAAVQNTFADGLQVYPNPVQDQLWVKVPQNYSNAKYVIWNSMGAKIMGGAVEGSGAFSIGLPAISAGMYTLELIGENRTEKVKFMVTGLR